MNIIRHISQTSNLKIFYFSFNFIHRSVSILLTLLYSIFYVRVPYSILATGGWRTCTRPAVEKFRAICVPTVEYDYRKEKKKKKKRSRLPEQCMCTLPYSFVMFVSY